MVVIDGQLPRESPLVGSPVRVPHCPSPKNVCFAHCGTLMRWAAGRLAYPLAGSSQSRHAMRSHTRKVSATCESLGEEIKSEDSTALLPLQSDGAAAARCCCRNDRPLAGLTPPALMPGPTQPDACFHSCMPNLASPAAPLVDLLAVHRRRRGFGTLACTLACTLAWVLNPVHWRHSRRWRTRRASWSMAAGSTPPPPEPSKRP